MGFGIALAWAVPAVTASAAVGSVATKETNSRWYKTLDKPAFQPPPVVFPIAWTALYASIAGSAAAVEAEFEAEAARTTELGRRRMTGDPEAPTAGERPIADRRRRFRMAVAINLLLNAGWCWVFFRWRRLPEATVVAGALAASTADLARRAAREKPAAGAALLPYAGWTVFATVLTDAIRRGNPRR